jgi:hypothetical protein
MKKHILVAGAALLALSFSASMASAQCAYQHPKSAKQLKSSLVQAMVSCGNPGGNTPNSTTEGGVPTCKPPQTFHEKNGNQAGGWLWGPSSKGDVTFKAGKNKINPTNDPAVAADSGDLYITLKMSGIVDNTTLPASGNGSLSTVARATLKDRANGDMTVVDFPAGFGITAVSGKINRKTSANDLLVNVIGQPALPSCSSIEVVDVNVIDENGDNFARMGTFIPLQ